MVYFSLSNLALPTVSFHHLEVNKSVRTFKSFQYEPVIEHVLSRGGEIAMSAPAVSCGFQKPQLITPDLTLAAHSTSHFSWPFSCAIIVLENSKKYISMAGRPSTPPRHTRSGDLPPNPLTPEQVRRTVSNPGSNNHIDTISHLSRKKPVSKRKPNGPPTTPPPAATAAPRVRNAPTPKSPAAATCPRARAMPQSSAPLRPMQPFNCDRPRTLANTSSTISAR